VIFREPELSCLSGAAFPLVVAETVNDVGQLLRPGGMQPDSSTDHDGGYFVADAFTRCVGVDRSATDEQQIVTVVECALYRHP
jgi:hypothetical protein